jgi:hypothetical protein
LIPSGDVRSVEEQEPRQRRQFRVTADEDVVVIEVWQGADLGTAGYDSIVLTLSEAEALRNALAAALEHPGSAAVTRGR